MNSLATAVIPGKAPAQPIEAPPAVAPSLPIPGPDWQSVRQALRRWRLELILLVLVYGMVTAGVVGAFLASRFADPALFAWGQRLLSAERGAWMSAVLPVGGLALVAAVHFARRGQQRRLIGAVLVALLAGGTFVAVAAIDYDSKIARRLVPGQRFRPSERYVARRFGVRLPRGWQSRAGLVPTAVASAPRTESIVPEISAAHGQTIFMRVCASCHGARGEGMIGSGKALRQNDFVAGLDDAKLVDFLKVGRQPWEPENTTKVQMPARGGDPRVTDDDLRSVVAYLREMQQSHPAPAPVPASTTDAGTTTQPAAPTTEGPGAVGEEPAPAIVYRSYLPEAPDGPRGLSTAYAAKLAQPIWSVPEQAQNYFSMFFALTGLGSLHVLAALVGVLVVLIAALRLRLRRMTQPALIAATFGWWWATSCWALVYILAYA